MSEKSVWKVVRVWEGMNQELENVSWPVIWSMLIAGKKSFAEYHYMVRPCVEVEGSKGYMVWYDTETECVKVIEQKLHISRRGWKTWTWVKGEQA